MGNGGAFDQHCVGGIGAGAASARDDIGEKVERVCFL